MMSFVRHLIPLLLAPLLPLTPLACAPAPKSLPCSNASDCRAHGDGYEYCLEGRCVRCISRSMCDPGELCVDGECVSR